MESYMPTDAVTMTKSKKHLWLDQSFYWVMLNKQLESKFGKSPEKKKKKAGAQFSLKSM